MVLWKVLVQEWSTQKRRMCECYTTLAVATFTLGLCKRVAEVVSQESCLDSHRLTVAGVNYVEAMAL